MQTAYPTSNRPAVFCWSPIIVCEVVWDEWLHPCNPVKKGLKPHKATLRMAIAVTKRIAIFSCISIICNCLMKRLDLTSFTEAQVCLMCFKDAIACYRTNLLTIFSCVFEKVSRKIAIRRR